MQQFSQFTKPADKTYWNRPGRKQLFMRRMRLSTSSSAKTESFVEVGAALQKTIHFLVKLCTFFSVLEHKFRCAFGFFSHLHDVLKTTFKVSKIKANPHLNTRHSKKRLEMTKQNFTPFFLN